MPRTCIDTADAVELAETLQLIADWLAALAVMVDRYLQCADTGLPVHTWPVARAVGL